MKLSDAELEIMEKVWEMDGPVTAARLTERLAEKGWKPSTLLTFLARMVNKGALAVEKRGKGGTKIADIAPMIKSASVTAGAGTLVIDAVVNASGESYLNPAYIVSSLAPGCAFSRVTRLSFLDADGRAFA